MKQERVWLGGLLVLALALRLGWGLSRDASDAAALRSLPDQREYLELGRNLLNRHTLLMHDPRFDADVYAFRTPGYPIFIALCGGNIRALRTAQAIVDTLTVLASFLLARRWHSFRLSLLAAAIVAINPFLIYFSALILSETLFIALLAWGMFLLTRKVWWIGAIVLALAVTVRPGAIGLPILLALGSARGRKSLIRAAVSAVMIVVVIFPWAWRNHNVLGRWIWTSTNDGFTLYDGFNPDATGASDQHFVVPMHNALTNKTEVERSDYLSGLAMRSIKDVPARAILLALKKVARTWSPIPLSKEYGTNVTVVVVALMYTIPLFTLVLLGLTRGTLSVAEKVCLMLPAIYLTAAAMASVGSLRYRLPADVPMAIVAAAGIAKRRTSEQLNA